ncbi:MAG: DUF4199 family protein [Chitinophagaceae bacterium]|nr:DUF4199 family protein [Chitinophagaceae bacterium]
MNKITPLLKGVITGIIMVLTTLLLIYTQSPSSPVQYIVYAIYAGGIAWTLLAYYRSPEYSPKFGDIFSRGFRCFIIVTLIMVTFVGIFGYMHPEYAKKEAAAYKAYLDEDKKSNRTPIEKAEMVRKMEKNFIVSNMSGAMFGTMITGAIFTAVGAGLMLMRRK